MKTRLILENLKGVGRTTEFLLNVFLEVIITEK